MGLIYPRVGSMGHSIVQTSREHQHFPVSWQGPYLSDCDSVSVGCFPYIFITSACFIDEPASHSTVIEARVHPKKGRKKNTGKSEVTLLATAFNKIPQAVELSTN